MSFRKKVKMISGEEKISELKSSSIVEYLTTQLKAEGCINAKIEEKEYRVLYVKFYNPECTTRIAFNNEYTNSKSVSEISRIVLWSRNNEKARTVCSSK